MQPGVKRSNLCVSAGIDSDAVNVSIANGVLDVGAPKLAGSQVKNVETKDAA
jgi:HSP20 family molecular chaperone IbpA